MKKFTSVLTLLSASIALAACGGGGGGGDDEVEQDAAIRGVINQTLPAAALPSAALPSAELPSAALPATSLPSTEVAPLDDVDEEINVTLQRSQEVSLTSLVDSNPGSSATANISVNTTTGAFTATVTALGFPTGEVTMVHIHDGFAGNNGGIIVNNFTEGASGVFSASGTLSTEQVSDYLTGGLYFNLHTQSNPSGELRGQIVNAETTVIRTELQSQQEVVNDSLPVVRDTSAVGYFTTALPIANDNPVITNVQVSGFVPSLPGNPRGPVHVHSAPAGQNGPILFALQETNALGTADETSNGVFWTSLNNPTALDALERSDIRNATGFGNGNYYFNVHSAANLGGEVRGQIVPDGVTIERVEIQTAQEIPVVTTPSVSDAANGELGGIGYIVTRDAISTPPTPTALIGAQVQVIGFDPALPEVPSPVHIHRGFAGATGGIDVILTDIDPEGDNVPASTFFNTQGQDLTGFNADSFGAGENYINVHSQANASGEIRAQITPTGIRATVSELQGEQEPQGVNATANPDAAGVAFVTIDERTAPTVRINARVSGFTPSLPGNAQGPFHLHRGFAGVNGNIAVGELQGLIATPPADPEASGAFTEFNTPTPILVSDFANQDQLVDDLSNLLAGGLYFNAHSDANTGGELRGQVTPEGIQATRSELEAQQEPQGATSELGFIDGVQGVAFTTIDERNELDPSVRINARVSGFTPALPGNAQGPFHLHRGFAGINGNIAVGELQGLEVTPPIDPAAPGAFTEFNTPNPVLVSEFNASAATDAADLLAGGLYFNVHSEQNLGGELRGQLVPRDIQATRSELEASQEPQGSDTTANPDATSVAFVTIDERNIQEASVRINARVSGFTPALPGNPQGPFHLHRGFAGINGNIAVGLEQNLTSSLENTGLSTEFTQFTSLDPILVSDFASSVETDTLNLFQGGFYFNVHSEANPNGELRGQLITDNNVALRGDLDSLQTLPPQTNLATGVGFLTVTNVQNGLFLSNVILNELDGIDFDTVSVNVGGNNNNLLQELEENDDANVDNTFSNEIRAVANLNGLLNNNAYSFNASED